MSKITNREVLSFFLGALVALLVFNVWIESAGQRKSNEAAKHFALPIPSGGHLAVSDNDGIAIIVVDPSKFSFRNGRQIVSRNRR